MDHPCSASKAMAMELSMAVRPRMGGRATLYERTQRSLIGAVRISPGFRPSRMCLTFDTFESL